jgi:di/tricarboxylate transporter
MTPDIVIVLVLLLAVMVVFSFDWLSVDVVTLGLIAALVLTGILTPQEAFAGFANEVLIILASVFIISGTLIKTGVTDWLAQFIYRLGHRRERRVLTYLMSLAAVMSAFFSNTSTTAVLTPTALELAREAKISPSRFLMPLAFASVLGGTCTLIGTSTNMAGSSMVVRLGLEPFSLFEFVGIGLILAFAGIVYMVLLGYRLIPARRPTQLTEDYNLHQFLTVLVPTDGSPAIDQALGDLKLDQLGLTPLVTIKNGKRLSAHPLRKVRADTRIIVKGSPKALMRAKAEPAFAIEADVHFGDADLSRDESAMGEAVLMPQSHLIGKTLKQVSFFHRFGLIVLAIYRQGQAHPSQIENMRLKVGDVLLLHGLRENLDRLKGNLDLWGLMQVEGFTPTKRQGIIALAALGIAILLGSTTLLPLSIALLMAVLTLAVTRCVTMEDAYTMIEWRLLILIAGMTSFGFAMQKTGAADYLAQQIVALTLPLGVYAALMIFCVSTVLLTQPLSNAAAALAMLPVAVAAADSLAVDPRSIAILVTLSASLSFITPLEPASLLVYGPGKYRFLDFMRSGLPLTVLMVALLLWLVPVFWPLFLT